MLWPFSWKSPTEASVGRPASRLRREGKQGQTDGINENKVADRLTDGHMIITSCCVVIHRVTHIC